MMMKRRKEIKMMKQIMTKQMRIERGRRANKNIIIKDYTISIEGSLV